LGLEKNIGALRPPPALDIGKIIFLVLVRPPPALVIGKKISVLVRLPPLALKIGEKKFGALRPPPSRFAKKSQTSNPNNQLNDDIS